MYGEIAMNFSDRQVSPGVVAAVSGIKGVEKVLKQSGGLLVQVCGDDMADIRGELEQFGVPTTWMK